MSIEALGVVVRAAGEPARVEELLLEEPGPGEVLVRMLATGVCHSDLHAKQGNMGREFPYLLGHESTAVVEAVGAGVTRPVVGDTVILSWRAPCGSCRACLAGRPENCPKPLVARAKPRTKDGTALGRVLGLGTFATRAVVAAGQAIPVAKDLAPTSTCLIGCGVATGVGAALYAARVPAGSSVAVFGCGAVGLSVVQGARLAHASRIIAVDVVARKLEWARSFGATHTVNGAATDPIEAIREITGGEGVSFAFEAVGLAATVVQALRSCELGGSCFLIGVPAAKAELSYPLSRLFNSRVTIRPTFYGDCLPARDFPVLAQLYRSGALKLDELVTGRIELAQVDESFAALERGEILRAVVTFPE